MSDLEIAMYLDRRLSPADLDRAEAHLAECAQCREELLAARGLVRRAQRPRRLAVAGALTAAVALILMLAPALRDRATGGSDSQMRSGTDPSALVAYGPLGRTSTESPAFTWGAAPGAASYRLTLTRDDGAAVWSHSGADTARTLPDSVSLRRGASYWWVADALLEDGTTRSTGLREFQIAP